MAHGRLVEEASSIPRVYAWIQGWKVRTTITTIASQFERDSCGFHQFPYGRGEGALRDGHCEGAGRTSSVEI